MERKFRIRVRKLAKIEEHAVIKQNYPFNMRAHIIGQKFLHTLNNTAFEKKITN